MRFLLRVSCFLILISMTSIASGQTVFKGEILGRGNLKAINEVTVIVKSDSTGSTKTYSFSNGKFEIEASDKEDVVFQAEGYRDLLIRSTAMSVNSIIYLDPINWDNNRIQAGGAYGIENPIGLNLEIVSPIIADSDIATLALGADVSYQGDLDADYWVNTSVTLYHILHDRFINLDLEWKNSNIRQTGDFNYYTNSISFVFSKHAGLKGSVGLAKFRQNTDETFLIKRGAAIGIEYWIKDLAILEVNANVIQDSNEIDVRLSRWFGSVNVFANYHELGTFQEFAIGLKKRFWY